MPRGSGKTFTELEKFMKKNNLTSYAAAEVLMQAEKKQTASQILEEVTNEMCDKYCKYPAEYEAKYGEDDERMYDEVCDNCPLNKLI